MADAYDGPDARAAKRVSCCLGAIVYSRGKPYSSEVKDISILGCRLRLPSLEAASSLRHGADRRHRLQSDDLRPARLAASPGDRDQVRSEPTRDGLEGRGPAEAGNL